MNKRNHEGELNIGVESLSMIRLTDDIAMIAENKRKLQGLIRMHQIIANMKIKINEEKTNVGHCQNNCLILLLGR